jgi:hypothetical protein
MRIRKRNIAWLSVLAALIGAAFLSGTASVQVMSALVALFAVAFVASMIELRPTALRASMPTSPLTRMRMSTDAREAAERARRRVGATYSGLTLLDIGLISSQASPDGMVMRKSRSVSGDDDGVRPFVTLHVPPAEADRSALIRFEIMDQNGQTCYVHETRTYLRDGEMNILADHHLPLINNAHIGRSGGEWDLRVAVDSVWVGMLAFTVSPSVNQRERDLARLADEPPAEAPLSFEELLRGQNNQSKS